MNKTAIKNFAIWARNKLIADIRYRAGLMGITEDGIAKALPQSVGKTEFYDIGSSEPYMISGQAIEQRRHLVELLQKKTRESNFKTAYKYVIEEVAYTWFNRLIAVRFMEVNDYLPSHVRVLSSESGKMEPDLVTTPFDAGLQFFREEEENVLRLQRENKLDELFSLLFIKQCNALNEVLPCLFEKTSDYTELLLNLSVIDKEGVVYRLVNDIPEEDFDVNRGGQVEIIGWLYQYYNTEPKSEAFAKEGKVTKEEIPAVTQLFTPDWIVRYMVENSLGRLWVEGRPNDTLKANWKYYLEEAEQEPEVQKQLENIRREYSALNPEDLKVIDPCMGSGHILVYAFDVLMQIYESAGYSQRDAAKSILEKNLYGLDIDDRAYQLAYFAVMMKARQYNRRILQSGVACHVYSIQESNGITTAPLHDMGLDLTQEEYGKAAKQIVRLIEEFKDAKEYGSIINITPCDWDLLRRFAVPRAVSTGQLELDIHGEQEASRRLQVLINIGEALSQKYHVVITNPPYMGGTGFSTKLSEFAKRVYPDSKSDLFAIFMERCLSLTKTNMFNAMITQQAWMTLSSYENLRVKINQSNLVCLAQLGARAFDEIGGEIVQTAAFVFRRTRALDYLSSFKKLIDYRGELEKEKGFFDDANNFKACCKYFESLPGKPYAYWVSSSLSKDFAVGRPISDYADSFQGIITGDNDRFLRFWAEVDLNNISIGQKRILDVNLSQTYWIPYNKGGEFRKWYGIQDYVVFWKNGPDDKTRGKKGFSDYYLREYVAWSYTVSNTIATRYYPPGFLWDVRGSGIMDKTGMMYYLEALISSKIGITLLRVNNSTPSCQVENILQFPIICDGTNKPTVDGITKENNKLSKTDWDSFETSWDFTTHPLIGGITMGRLISDKYKEWAAECDARFNQLKANEEELNRIFIEIYGLQDELTPEVEERDVTVRRAELQRDIKSLLSYAVGCMFGRYSLDVEGLAYAGGEWDGSKYVSFIPDADNVIPITDEEYLEDDVVSRLCTWLKVVYGEDTLEENLDFIAKALGNKGDTSRTIIRNYFLNDFFKDHCQTYSVTGSGKRPIYWLFDSGKQNGFKALVYLHRYTADTIGNLRVDYLHRMQRVYESEIDRMQDMMDHSTNAREVAAAGKRQEKLRKQLKECREYDEKIGHLALTRAELDLDDGVKYNYRKLQIGADGKFYEVLADSKAIMMDEKKYKDFKKH